MTKTIEAKAVREARAEARRMARRTELTYQQALDKVARDGGAEHWAAFAAMHPGVAAGTPSANTTPVVEEPPARPARRSGVRPLVRALASGEMAERALAGDEADREKEARHGFSPEVKAMATVAYVAAIFTGLGMPPTRILAVALLALCLVHGLRRLARLVGDHPSMATRRRQVRDGATMGVFLCLAFSAGSYWPEFADAAANATGLPTDRLAIAGTLGAVVMYVVRRHGVAAMLLEAPATIPRFDRTEPQSGYVAPAWFAGALRSGILLGTGVGIVGAAVAFVTSAGVLLHIVSLPSVYYAGGTAGLLGFAVAGVALWVEKRLHRSGYIEERTGFPTFGKA